MKRILVVDDNLLTLKQLEAQLSAQYEVVLAKSGKIALQMCQTELPDMIMLDVMMPDMDGFSLVKNLRGIPALEFVPIIVLTGVKDSGAELRCLELGVQDFISKPVNRNILLNRIALHIRLAAFQSKTEVVARDIEKSFTAMFLTLEKYKNKNGKSGAEAVSAYTAILAKEVYRRKTFGNILNDKDVERIIRASLLHDIGKVAIKDSILNKPSKLTEEEYSEVRQHAALGAQMVSQIYKDLNASHYMRCTMIGAQGHHEKWNGEGYPEGLQEDEIPLCARLIAPCSVYSALREEKPYRKAFSHNEACDIVCNGNGIDFDPKIISIFEELEDEFSEASKKFEANKI